MIIKLFEYIDKYWPFSYFPLAHVYKFVLPFSLINR